MWKKLLIAIVVLAVLFVLAIAVRGKVGFFGEYYHDDPPIAGRPECPRHKTIFVDSAGVWVPRETEIAGSGLISAVPEYHDCQRLKLPDQPKYGPLVAIFARINLIDLSDPPGFIPPTPVVGVPYHMVQPVSGLVTSVALPTISIVPAPPPPSAGVTANKDGSEESVATILNYDEPYQPLRLPHAFSCLYVHHNGSVWMAELAKVDADTDCLKPMDTWPRRDTLNVRPTYDPNPPPVARWDWDQEAKEHFIGIRCGTSWCEVWNPDRPTLTSSPPQGMGKGWYDEQYLAEKATTAGHPDGLTPGAAIGDVLPMGDLTAYEAGDGAAFASTWIQVARVTLSEKSAKYENKYHYIKHDPNASTGFVVVSLCKGTASDCHLSLWYQLTVNRCDNDKDPWYARIDSPKGTKYRCVIRRKPEDPNTPLAPGIVRWRWRIKDEGMWIRCPGGCCEKT